MDVKSILDALQLKYTTHDRYFKMKCINHPTPDTHPSMTMLKESGYFRCWSCGFRGPLTKFLKFFPDYKLDMQEELFLATLPEEEAEAQNWVSGKIHSVEGKIGSIWDNKELLAYLHSEERGYFNREFLKDFGVIDLVDATVNGTHVCKRMGVPLYFQGNLVSMEMRTYAGGKPKVLYPKNASASFLFNSDNLNLNEIVYLSEGIFDLPSVYCHSKNVTSPFGVSLSKLQRLQIKLIPRLCILPDNDEAGQEFIREVFRIRDKEFLIASPPPHRKDPGVTTPEEIGYAIRNPLSSAEWYLRYYLPQGLQEIEEQAQTALWMG